MKTYTPGPWGALDDTGKYNSEHEWSVCDDAEESVQSEAAPIWAGNEIVAFAVYSSTRRHGEPTCTDANARLISAAPDLLEFARAVVRYAGNGCDDYLCNKARDVIAKAVIAT